MDSSCRKLFCLGEIYEVFWTIPPTYHHLSKCMEKGCSTAPPRKRLYRTFRDIDDFLLKNNWPHQTVTCFLFGERPSTFEDPYLGIQMNEPVPKCGPNSDPKISQHWSGALLSHSANFKILLTSIAFNNISDRGGFRLIFVGRRRVISMEGKDSQFDKTLSA